MIGLEKKDPLAVKQEPKRSLTQTEAILLYGPDSDDPIYHDQENDEKIDKRQFGGSYMHPIALPHDSRKTDAVLYQKHSSISIKGNH
jgi:hypothetical protein